MTNKIEVKSLTKKIGSKTIIKNVSFEISTGDICGFIGPNGAGKTTIIRLLTGLIKPTVGSIFVNEYNINTNRKNALLKVGAIVESPIFFNYMSGKDNLENLARLNSLMTRKEQLEKVQEVLKIVGLEDRGNEKVKTYSMGMKQRLGIAQALLNNPEIIILDEPMNGLDPIGMKDLRELIINLHSKYSITFFISSHLLDELKQLCNNFIIINNGELIWKGSKDKLIALSGNKNNIEDAFIDLVTSSSFSSRTL